MNYKLVVNSNLSPARLAFEKAFAYKRDESKDKNVARILCNVPIIGGLAALYLLYACYNLHENFPVTVTAERKLAKNPFDPHAEKALTTLRKINTALKTNVFIAFTPLAPCLLPLQITATLMRFSHNYR
ncbi:hypothetical protein PHSC3_001823 [Chlamydiales bacterium STE3]|nr:hypothetical protein PHSC3_001823 [Chlamydiales bacterium STE3]